ncbi:unnamed protein product [Hermetia illucens]|uniref:Spp2/MOS2 G-patch domain-containing protein n=1 Tax=Hermetia illucens TaxID=343691 RepID=A0A7R8V4R7_HERIL|nr:unnamed protein product [Hermetia illucens]
MEPKKISFGFSKIQKKPNVLSATSVKEDNKVELIKCLEGQTIKLVEEKPKEEAKPLVIPMKESTRTAAALASLKARHDILNGIIAPQSDENNSDSKPKEVSLENETIEQRAARELLQSVTKTEENGTDDGKSAIAIPKPDELPLDGAKESTFDDYESTPITQFGYAMLRGMGWKDEPKSKDDKKDLMEPFVRPKGMGLGADKIAKPKPLLIPPDANETLEIKKNACVKILAGKHKDLYGQLRLFELRFCWEIY